MGDWIITRIIGVTVHTLVNRVISGTDHPTRERVKPWQMHIQTYCTIDIRTDGHTYRFIVQ